MELGIFSRTYEVNGLDKTYQRMTSHGIYHTQFNLSNVGLASLPKEIDVSKLEEIHEMNQKYGVTIDCLSGTFNMIGEDRESGIAQFELQCQIAHELEIPIVSLCTGSKNKESKWKWSDENLTKEAWNDLMDTTRRILIYAQKYDVILGVETEASNIVNNAKCARKYLDEVNDSHLKIIMDGANLFHIEQISQMKEVLNEAFSLLGNDIVLAHAKDFDSNLNFVAAGKGILDFDYYTKLLKKAGYTGPLVMHGLSEEEVPSSVEFLRKYL